MKFEKWWRAMKADHVILDCFYRSTDHGNSGPFTLWERWLCMGLAVACSWFSVYFKYYHLQRIVHSEDVISFPDRSWANQVDSIVCAVGASSVDAVLGRQLVRKVLRLDWDSQGGLKGAISHLANFWAMVLMVAALVHCVTIIGREEDPELQHGLLKKVMMTSFIKMILVETLLITVGVSIAADGASVKASAGTTAQKSQMKAPSGPAMAAGPARLVACRTATAPSSTV
eukprot:TRINITY_DN52593_c0_g1_i1.p1 TRINITY_DN52593_c0_g1~~TRINITY_DN52593_c0_g1_i1.p1  ORF type:complete len:250 (+),score=17.04 TRINITY_DN52593_c0_g1_i1:64-750(+)